MRDIVVRTYKFKRLSLWINEVRLIGFAEIPKAWYRLLSLYIKRPAYRKAIREMTKEARAIPKNFFEYVGYGIYVGIKN
ncbi:MAG: hypothetical protein ACE5K0_02285 [Candidatus Methanofastidiosia archaeon]